MLADALRLGSSRLELPTSRLSGARSNLLSYEPMPRCRSRARRFFSCPRCDPSLIRYHLVRFRLPDGDDGIRTHDPLLAGQVLSQLSYTPMLDTHLLLSFCNER